MSDHHKRIYKNRIQQILYGKKDLDFYKNCISTLNNLTKLFPENSTNVQKITLSFTRLSLNIIVNNHHH